jgi:hypothetical protein
MTTLRLIGRHLQGDREKLRVFLARISAKQGLELVSASHSESPRRGW